MLSGSHRLQYLKVLCDDAELIEYEEGRSKRQKLSQKRITRTDLCTTTLPPLYRHLRAAREES